MDFCKNFPLFSIVICLMGGVLSSALKKKAARVLSYIIMLLLIAMSVGVLVYCIQSGESFVYKMGHFPAPWGNEVRAGVLEGMFAVFFSVVMFLAVFSGEKYLDEDIVTQKGNLYFSLILLLMSSLLALVYTNDIFTGYVFVEINTISAAGLVAVKNNGRSCVAAVKYMIMSLLGSGLLLIGIIVLYDITGNLLLESIHSALGNIITSGNYTVALTIVIALITVGLSIKSALFPFHSWLPDAHSASTISSSAVLSSLVLKAYIIFLIKIFYRAIGIDVIVKSGVCNVLFVCGIAGMLIGSLFAAAQEDVKRMIAYSSVAQIGYIFMGLGLGTELGLIAAVYHIFMHGSTKSMLFMAVGGLKEVSGH